MPNGATGHLTGAHAVANARSEENQFQRSQDPERVFQKRMEARIAPSLKTKPERTRVYYSQRFETAQICPAAPDLQYWDRGVLGLPVLKHAFLWVSQCLNEKRGDPATKHSYLQMKP